MSVLKAAGLIGAIALISKFIGLFREVFIGYYYGTNYIRDAYLYAAAFPSYFALIMLAGLNGPFHSSIVSVISKYKAQGKIEDTKTVVTTVTIISTIIMLIITLLCMKFAPQVIDMSTSDAMRPETRALAIEQLKIMSPMFLISGLIGISYGILNVEKIYLTTSLSPSMASISIILALLFASAQNGPVALAWGTMIGAIFQLLLQLIPMFPKMKDYFTLKFDYKHEGVKSVFSILLPATLSSTVGQINLIIIGYFASKMAEGANSALNSANLIFQLPLGIMLTALLVPMLPLLSESYIIKDNNKTFIKNLNKAIRSIIFLSLPIMAMLIFSSKMFTQILFQRGAFDEHSTYITSHCLITTTVSLLFYAIRDLLVRVFYAMNNASTPFYITVFSIITMTVSCWFFSQFHLEADGIALAVSFVTFFNMSILGITLYKKIGNWIEKETIKQFGKISIATIPVVGFCLLFNYLVDYQYNMLNFAIYSVLMAFVGVGCISSLRYMKDQETIEITDMLMRKLKIKK